MNIKKFLAIAFMCHQMPERSFFIKGKQFPLCARCTGILTGYFLGIFIACVTNCKNYINFIILIVPMIIDGGIQYVFKKESNNFRRYVTGLLGGIGIIYLLISIHMFTIWWVKIFLKFAKESLILW